LCIENRVVEEGFETKREQKWLEDSREGRQSAVCG
jgi:hypothetical protein